MEDPAGFIFPGEITVSQEPKHFVESHLVCLPLSGRTDVLKCMFFCHNEMWSVSKKFQLPLGCSDCTCM